jgi:hypothetical protein
MNRALTADGLCAEAPCVPEELRIPDPPRALRLALPRRESWWREAMRWSLLGLTASWAAGEISLRLLAP